MAGGGLGGRPAVAIAMFLASLVVAFPMISAAKTHTVGGSVGWTIPPNSSFYPSWSTSQKFAVGDNLAFNFQTGAHTVMEVPKSSYDACTTGNPVGPTLSTGPATVTITTAGSHYYICSVTGHCTANQKLAITVAGGSSSPSTPPVPGESSGGPVPSPTAGGPSGSSSPSGGSVALPTTTLGMAAAAGIFLAVALW